MATVTTTAGVAASGEVKGGGVARDVSEVGTGFWDRSILPRGFPDMKLGVRCHSCY